MVIEQDYLVVLAFNSMNGNLFLFTTTTLNFIDQFIRTQTAVERLGEVIEVKAETENDYQKSFADLKANENIICTNLSFHHPGRLDLLKNFSITLPGGKIIALIGQSGCGKSTLVKVIQGCTTQSGNIGLVFITTRSLDVTTTNLLVPQDVHFWGRSIIENFRLGSPSVTFEQIVEACRLTGADEFISQFPDKYQTILGEFGANLSGGQRQRLAPPDND